MPEVMRSRGDHIIKLIMISIDALEALTWGVTVPYCLSDTEPFQPHTAYGCVDDGDSCAGCSEKNFDFPGLM